MEQLNNETTFEQSAVQEQQTVKKPKKLGWIISLVILSLSVIGLVAGVTVSVVNNPQSLVENVEKGIKENSNSAFGKPEETLQSMDDLKNGFTYKVVKGNSFLIAIYNDENTDVPKLLVDGKEVKPFYTATNTKFAGEQSIKVKSYYYVTAENDKMSIKTEGANSDKTFPLLIVKPELVSKVAPLVIGGLIVLIFGITSVIALVPFIVFLVLFLKKNSAYKKANV